MNAKAIILITNYRSSDIIKITLKKHDITQQMHITKEKIAHITPGINY